MSTTPSRATRDRTGGPSDDHVASLNSDGVELLVVGDEIKRLDTAGSEARVELAVDRITNALSLAPLLYWPAITIRPSSSIARPTRRIAAPEVVGNYRLGKRRVQRSVGVEA